MRDGSRGVHSQGFSLVELLVVAAIIVLLSAISLPGISRYFRNYRIRGAQQQVASAIQTARNRAIVKNVNVGVAFVIESPTRYWVHVEDDQSAAHSRVPEALTFGAADAGQSAAADLPDGVRFAASAAECPDATLRRINLPGSFAPNAGWFRFTRLGGWCGVTCANPLATTPAAAVRLMNNASGSVVCLFQPATNLSRALVVSPGGRVLQSQ